MAIPLDRQHNAAYRRDSLWLAALVHRVSGVLLAGFLPLHFLALGLAIEGEARLDAFLRWVEAPLVKLAEAGLVFLLTIHLLGGLRVLVIETVGWRPWQKHAVLAGALAAAAAAAAFLIRAA
jgi:fumarate reductase subunit D